MKTTSTKEPRTDMRRRVLHVFVMSFFLLLVLSCSLQQERIDYVLSWTGDGLKVDVALQTDKDSVTLNFGSEAGGQTDQMSWIHDLTVTFGQLFADTANHHFTAIPSDRQVRFSYIVRSTLPSDYGSPGNCLKDMFRPDLDSSMFYSRTENLFVLPADADSIPVSVEWNAVPPYPLFCLYNPGKGTEYFDGLVRDLNWSVIVGDSFLTVDTVMVNSHPQYLVTALRQQVDENKVALRRFFRRVYASVSRFWGDDGSVPYSMIIFPFRRNTFEVSGNGYANGLLARYDATADTVLTKERRDVFVHEIGHKWMNNGTIWFAEGFNEMQTAYQLVASGLTSPDYFVTYFNHALSELWHNPHRNTPGQEAEDRFWEDGDYTWLLYYRGFTYAFHLAGLVEQQTQQPNSWRTMMQHIQPFVTDFSEEKFLEAMSVLIAPKRLNEDYRTFMTEGKDFTFHSEELPSGTAIELSADGVPQVCIVDTVAFARHFQ